MSVGGESIDRRDSFFAYHHEFVCSAPYLAGRKFTSSFRVAEKHVTTRRTQGQTLETILQSAIDAVGGAEALLGVSQWTIESTGAVYVQFESDNPGEITKACDLLQQTYAADLVNDKLSIASMLQPAFEIFQFFPVTEFSRIIDGRNDPNRCHVTQNGT